MKTFRVQLGAGAYLLRGQFEKRLDENTDYVIFASDLETATAICHEFVGAAFTHSSPRIQGVQWKELPLDEISGDNRYEYIARLLAEVVPFIGSIEIVGTLIISPEHEHDLFVMKCREVEKARVLIEAAYLREGNTLELGDTKQPLDYPTLADFIQASFP